MCESYLPIPVEAARTLAIEYRKSMVIIIAYDPAFKVTHTATYGVSPAEKVWAATVGERCTEVIGADLNQKTSFEDFRYRTEAEAAAVIDRLKADNEWLRKANKFLHENLVFPLGQGSVDCRECFGIGLVGTDGTACACVRAASL